MPRLRDQDGLISCLQDYNVISLFLLCNLLNATATIPVLLGLWRGPLAQRVVTPASCLFGCVLAMVAVIVYGVLQAPHWHMSVDAALHSVFLGDIRQQAQCFAQQSMTSSCRASEEHDTSERLALLFSRTLSGVHCELSVRALPFS